MNTDTDIKIKPAIIELKHSKQIVGISGKLALNFVDSPTIFVTLDETDQSAVEFFTSAFQACRKLETEARMLEAIKRGDFINALANRVYDDFSYPDSLTALTSDSVSLGRAKGKVTPGSIEIIIDHTKVTVSDIKLLKEKLTTIVGFHLVNTKPIPVVNGDGMPIAVKFIVSPKTI